MKEEYIKLVKINPEGYAKLAIKNDNGISYRVVKINTATLCYIGSSKVDCPDDNITDILNNLKYFTPVKLGEKSISFLHEGFIIDNLIPCLHSYC